MQLLMEGIFIGSVCGLLMMMAVSVSLAMSNRSLKKQIADRDEMIAELQEELASANPVESWRNRVL